MDLVVEKVPHFSVTDGFKFCIPLYTFITRSPTLLSLSLFLSLSKLSLYIYVFVFLVYLAGALIYLANAPWIKDDSKQMMK